MSRRAAVYLRISRDDQATGLAVDRQREDCLKIIADRGWELIGDPYVDNAVSASKRTVRREHYDRMVADFEAGAFDALVCYDLDRLTRQPRQLEDWIEAAEERDLLLVTANGEADLATDNGRLFARIKASVARAEIERKGARQRRANLQRADQGRPTPGRRRYGYESDGISPRESEAAHVRRMFEHIAAGGSIRSLAIALDAEGVDPAPGKSWSSGRVRYILKNPTYGGQVHRGGEGFDSSVVAPIVPAELAAEVRAILADEARTVTPGPRPRYLASGIAMCGVCHGPLLNLANAYRCKASASHPTIKRELLDARFRDEVALALLVANARVATTQSEAVAPLIAELDRNDAAVTTTLDDRDEGLIPATVARARLVELRAAREDIERRLEVARVERSALSALAHDAAGLLDGLDDVSVADFLGPIRRTVADRFADLDIDRQRDIARAVIQVSVNPGRHASRVKVWHLLADELNGDENADADGESRGPAPAGTPRRAPRTPATA